MSTSTYVTVPDVRPEAIVFYCSDPRLRDAFEGFIEDELELKGKHIALPKFGGPAAFANQGPLTSDHRSLRMQTEFALRHWKSIRRLVLIAHENCGYYKAKLHADYQEGKEKHDLVRAAEHLRHLFPGLTVELYYGVFANGEKTAMFFEEVDETALMVV